MDAISKRNFHFLSSRRTEYGGVSRAVPEARHWHESLFMPCRSLVCTFHGFRGMTTVSMMAFGTGFSLAMKLS